MANLLERLKESKVTGLSLGKTSKESKQYKSQIGKEEYKLRAELGWKKTKKKIAPLKSQFWDTVKMSQSDSIGKGVDYGGIMKVIDRHSFEFQECYERALLKDESLSGKVIFLLKLNSSAVKKAGLELKGKGNPNSRRDTDSLFVSGEQETCFFREQGECVHQV